MCHLSQQAPEADGAQLGKPAAEKIVFFSACHCPGWLGKSSLAAWLPKLSRAGWRSPDVRLTEHRTPFWRHCESKAQSLGGESCCVWHRLLLGWAYSPLGCSQKGGVHLTLGLEKFMCWLFCLSRQPWPVPSRIFATY